MKMKIRSAAKLGATILFSLFILATSFYCLLAYIPFTYSLIVRSTLVAWLSVFVKLHTLFYWVLLAALIWTMIPDLRRSETKRLAGGFIIVHLAVGLALIFRPYVSGLQNDDSSYLKALVVLIPVLWLAAIEFARRERWSIEGDAERLNLNTSLMSSGFLSALFAGSVLLRTTLGSETSLSRVEASVAISWSVLSHLVVFSMLFVVIRGFQSLSKRFSSPLMAEFLLCNLLALFLLTLVFKHIILTPISFTGLRADIFSLALSAATVFAFAGLSLCMRRDAKLEAESGLALSILPVLALTPRRSSSKIKAMVWLAALAGLSYGFTLFLSPVDWGGLIQKLVALTVWVATFAFFLARQSSAKSQPQSLALVLLAVVGLGGYKLLDLSRDWFPILIGREDLNVEHTLDKYEGFDASFQNARSWLDGTVGDRTILPFLIPTSREVPDLYIDEFFLLLRQNANLPDSFKVDPVEVKIVESLNKTSGRKPNIFIFVIDSLRQDYLSPYNEAVTFTPSIEEFARDSVVFRNTFSRYSGTVLSQASLWMGAMQLHKQFIKPYHPMNSLQKLVETEGYTSHMTIDPVLAFLIDRSAAISELDKGYEWYDYDFCRTRGEIEEHIDRSANKSSPIFLYTQPQNLHPLVLIKQKKADIGNYPGFNERYAAAVSRFDACFGQFINDLKAKGIYDDSIIILTSDHGEALGEEGRWGHGFTFYPEIIRVPLIMHIPPGLRKNLSTNSQDIAFTTDITPTLYYLLGHQPIIHNPLLGRPLMTGNADEAASYLQDHYLIASSYGPIFGILDRLKEQLFISDAMSKKEYLYDLKAGYMGKRERLGDKARDFYRNLIRDQIQAINQFYKVGDQP